MKFEEFKNKYEKVSVAEHPISNNLKPKVSVCIQTFQHVNFIKECLDGILMQQTNFDFEILLGEDASTDGTREICIDYAQKYPDKIRLFLHHRENNIFINGSPTGRFNFFYNLYSVKGKYIALCEGDDYWTDPYKLQKQVDFLEKNKKYSGCFHETYSSFASDNFSLAKKNIWRETLKKQLTIKDLLLNKYCLFHTSSFVFKNNLFVFPDWFSEISSGDLALFYLVAGHGPIGKVNGVMSVYRQHEGGISNTKEHNEGLAKSRTKLLELVDQYYNYKYTTYINKLIVAFKNNTPIKLPLSYRIKNKMSRLFN